MKKIKEVGFTENVVMIVQTWTEMRGGNVQDYLREMAKIIRDVPQGRFTEDTSDNMLSFAGIRLSFLRDWNTGKAWVMTNAEATDLDIFAAKHEGREGIDDIFNRIVKV